MKIEKLSRLSLIHLFLGLFFTISGISIFSVARLIFSIWIISLGLFFLLETFQESLSAKLNPQSIKNIHYILTAIIIITGVAVLLN